MGCAAALAQAPARAEGSQPRFEVRAADDAWRAALPMDADAATQSYMDRLPAATVARSNSYFEGGYWLQLWNWLAGIGVAWVLLQRRRSSRVREAIARRLHRPWLRDAAYGAFYGGASWLLTLPLTIYQGYFREHQYGLATQTFGPWFGEQLTMLALSLVAAAFGAAIFYAALRRAGANWWLWGTGVMVALEILVIVVAPVWIDPLFNTYKPVEDGPVKTAVLAMARASGVPADNVYVFDASRQTTRVSANVSGLFGTAAVRLNDNLLRRTSLPEIRAVTAHEIGHYALNHVGKMVLMFGVLFAIGLRVVQFAQDRLLARHGARWGLQGASDVAALPLLMALISTFFLVATPLINTMVRSQEVEADRYGVALAREPLGMAEVMLKLVEYRKPDPGPWEEAIFFDHPSARSRIHNAMVWRQQMQGY